MERKLFGMDIILRNSGKNITYFSNAHTTIKTDKNIFITLFFARIKRMLTFEVKIRYNQKQRKWKMIVKNRYKAVIICCMNT